MKNLAQKTANTKQIRGISDLLARLSGVKKSGKRYSAKCPNHDDAKNSLLLSEQPNGKITIDCKAGCQANNVLAKINLTFADLYPEPIAKANGKAKTNGKGEFVCSYDYTDENGNLLYSKDRYQITLADGTKDKAFCFRQPNGANNLDGVRRVLYNLPEIVERPDETIYLCEGEKDADTLANRGYLATTSDAGAANWRDEYTETLRGRNVIIVVDHDKPGIERGQQLAPKLHAAGCEVYTLDCFADEPLPEKHGRDVTDYFAAGATTDDFITLCEHAPLFEPTPETLENIDLQTNGKKDKQAKLLVAIGQTADLFHTPKGEPFASLTDKNERFETCGIESKIFRQWLEYNFWKQTGDVPSADSVKQAVSILSSSALYEGNEREVYTRLAHAGGKNYLDLCDDARRVVEIAPGGWQVIAAKVAPVRFRRAVGMLALPEPKAGGSIESLRKFINVATDEDWLLVASWIVAALRGDAPKYPVLSITGEQGSAKSTLSIVLRQLIDPNDAPLRMPSKDLRDLCITANNSFIVAFNNLSRLDEWFSDALCCVCEGGGFAVRQNYSDDAEIIFKARRPIILNGIADVTTKSDLLDRAICLHLPTISETERKNEKEFFAEFYVERPQILGAYLTAACATMRNLPTIKPTKKEPRMIDFALWARAAETALGFKDGDFMRAYLGNRETGNAAAIENSPLALTIQDFISTKERGYWFGSCTELLKELKAVVDVDFLKSNFPKTPNHLSRQLNRIAPNLRLAGISITKAETNTGTNFTMQKKEIIE